MPALSPDMEKPPGQALRRRRHSPGYRYSTSCAAVVEQRSPVLVRDVARGEEVRPACDLGAHRAGGKAAGAVLDRRELTGRSPARRGVDGGRVGRAGACLGAGVRKQVARGHAGLRRSDEEDDGGHRGHSYPSGVARRPWRPSLHATRLYSPGAVGAGWNLRAGKVRAGMFTKVLVANRGEIAIRVMRSARGDRGSPASASTPSSTATRCTSSAPTRRTCWAPGRPPRAT